MKNNNFKYAVILLAALLIFASFVGCKSTAPATPKVSGSSKLKIKSVSWLIDRLDTSIWNKVPNNNAQMFMSFYISYEGEFDTSYIKNIIIDSPVDVWNLKPAQIENIIEIQEQKKLAIIKWLRCGEGTGAVSLGKWSFLLNETSGHKYEQKLMVSVFEKIVEEFVDTKEPIHSVEKKEKEKIKKIVVSPSSKNEIEAIKMPVIHSVSKDENSIEIYFTVNDNRVKNGYFWFSVPGEKYYKDSGSMIDASGTPVNGCRKFSITGEKSHYILRKNADNAEWFDNIEAIYFVASDANRVESPWKERIRTVSAKSTAK